MQELKSSSIDLVYLDPPFNSNRQYTAIYKDETGRPLPDQVEAFCDMWELDAEREEAIRAIPVLMRESGLDDSATQLWRLWMHSLRNTQPRLLAYLSYMTQRLLVIHRLLKPTGSLYLHCDPTASHYIKAILDAILGHHNFRNEITWQRSDSHNTARRYGNIADTILFYTKTQNHTWNRMYTDYGPEQRKRFRHNDGDRRWYKLENLTAPRPNSDSGKFEWRGTMPPPSRGWGYRREQLEQWWQEGRIKAKRDGTPRMDGLKVYLDEARGKPLQNIWTDIPRIANTSPERMGYDTQKPLALLDRIIESSSNPGDVILDPFCGCATTMESAHRLGRNWIGIDIAIHAIKRVARVRLNGRLGLVEGKDYVIEGIPNNIEGAQDLWVRDKYQFQKWAVEQVEGFVTAKRTADGGIDGRVYFAIAYDKPLQSMILAVTGGANVTIRHLRELKGVLDADEARMAGLITMHPRGPTQQRNFEQFCATAGNLNVLGINYPRMQMLSVSEILDGKRFATPTVFGRHHREPQLPGLPVAIVH